MPLQTAVVKSHILCHFKPQYSKGSNKRTVLNNSTGHQNPQNLQIVQGYKNSTGLQKVKHGNFNDILVFIRKVKLGTYVDLHITQI